MQASDKVFKDLFNQTDSILIMDTHGKVLFYQDYNDQINMIRDENAIGRTIFELYPFFKREDFTLKLLHHTRRLLDFAPNLWLSLISIINISNFCKCFFVGLQ